MMQRLRMTIAVNPCWDERREQQTKGRQEDGGEHPDIMMIRHRSRGPHTVIGSRCSGCVSTHVVEQPIEIGPSLKVVVLGVGNAAEHREIADLAERLVAFLKPGRQYVEGSPADSRPNENRMLETVFIGMFRSDQDLRSGNAQHGSFMHP